jgi:hypothetical protein
MTGYTVVINRKPGKRTVYEVRHDQTGLILFKSFKQQAAFDYKPPVFEPKKAA